MYHAQTSEEIKSFILASFKDSQGSVLVLVAMIAFGMGVDCKELYTIIHYGPPAAIEDYFQETGRAGRDGKHSQALLLMYESTRSKNIAKEMKNYLTNDTFCRRALLLQVFGTNGQSICPKHNCCDVCSVTCDCGNCNVIVP